jgi:hypothetical protein
MVPSHEQLDPGQLPQPLYDALQLRGEKIP